MRFIHFIRFLSTIINKENEFMRTETVRKNNTTKGTMEEKGMKGKLNGLKKKLLPAGMGSMMAVMLMNTTCFAAAAGTSAVTQPLENLKTLVIAVIGAVGVIILAKNVMEFAQAYQQQDSSTMNSALKGIVAGVMMAGISTVLSFLGF
jgi:energy-converting hydrogenase Eha subunit C